MLGCMYTIGKPLGRGSKAYGTPKRAKMTINMPLGEKRNYIRKAHCARQDEDDEAQQLILESKQPDNTTRAWTCLSMDERDDLVHAREKVRLGPDKQNVFR